MPHLVVCNFDCVDDSHLDFEDFIGQDGCLGNRRRVPQWSCGDLAANTARHAISNPIANLKKIPAFSYPAWEG